MCSSMGCEPPESRAEGGVADPKSKIGLLLAKASREMWDSSRERLNIREMGAIDDGRLPEAISPLCDSLIVTPDGRFIGE